MFPHRHARPPFLIARKRPAIEYAVAGAIGALYLDGMNQSRAPRAARHL